MCGFVPCIIGQLGQRVEVAAGGGAAVGEGWVGDHDETFVWLLLDFKFVGGLFIDFFCTIGRFLAITWMCKQVWLLHA